MGVQEIHCFVMNLRLANRPSGVIIDDTFIVRLYALETRQSTYESGDDGPAASGSAIYVKAGYMFPLKTCQELAGDNLPGSRPRRL